MEEFKMPSAPWGAANPSKHAEARTHAANSALALGFGTEGFVEIDVRWGDQDMNGHVNNCVFFKWLETGRIHYVNELWQLMTDVTHLPPSLSKDESTSSTANSDSGAGPAFGKAPVGLILGSVGCKYIKPVFAKDTVLVAHKLKKVEDKKFTMEAYIWSYAQGGPVAKGESVMHTFDYTTQKAMPIPDGFKVASAKVMAQQDERTSVRAKL